MSHMASIIVVGVILAVALPAQETRPARDREAATAKPQEAPAVPRVEFPHFSAAPEALEWLTTSRLKTIKAIRRAQLRRDPTTVARLLVLLEDIRRHAAVEAERLLHGASPGSP